MMSARNESHSESPHADELVAYLDGELAPAECRAVEDRLASDVAYRQRLRDFDQAWEALAVLPTTAVDDGFARTTIELACVAAQDDLSQKNSVVTAENRTRRRWWLAGSLAAAAMAFLMIRALAAHRRNAELADLPVIQQSGVLAHVESVEFLQKLSQAVSVEELVRDSAAYENALADFRNASSKSFAERRRWIESLAPERKAVLVDAARALNDSQQELAVRDRGQKLMQELADQPNLQQTLVAFGQWLDQPPEHTGGWKEQLRTELSKLSSTSEQVAVIRRRLDEETGQLRRLSADDRVALRRAIFALVEATSTSSRMRLPPEGVGRPAGEKVDLRLRPALETLVEIFGKREEREATMNRLVGQLSPATQDHWKKLRGRERFFQFARWLRDALRPTERAEELELFFASDQITPEERQRLLNMPREEMKSELESRYLSSQFGFDDRLLWRELSELGRGQGPGGGPPEQWRRGEGPRGFGGPPPGPPGESGFGPGGPPGPGGFRRPRPDVPLDRRMPPNDRRRRTLEDRPPGPPPQPPEEQPI